MECCAPQPGREHVNGRRAEGRAQGPEGMSLAAEGRGQRGDGGGQRAEGRGQRMTCLPHKILTVIREVTRVEGLPALYQLESALPETQSLSLFRPSADFTPDKTADTIAAANCVNIHCCTSCSANAC